MRSALLVLALLLVARLVFAQADGRGTRNPPPIYPWQRPGYQGYASGNELWYATPPSERGALARKYHLFVTPLPVRNTEGDLNSALLVAHLPDQAQIWLEGVLMQQRGNPRRILSPPLTPGKEYAYTVVVKWYEDGQWVSQEHQFPVHAGDVHCIDIIPSKSQAVDQEITKNLAGLQPEDRTLAKAQRYCAVQAGIRLGSMGAPVKVVLKGEPVFLCCEACVKKAQSDPDLTLDQVRKIKTKTATPGVSQP
jgi:uncharacterized protein (TIGR03000 family)